MNIEMNMVAIKWLLIIGGGILVLDGVASAFKFHEQAIFYQIVRLERTLFALILVIVGVFL